MSLISKLEIKNYMKLSRKTYILIAIIVVAVSAVALFWHSSKKEVVTEKNQPADLQNVQPAIPDAPPSVQTGQANPADQISAIDKAARENLGGDYKIEGASFVSEPKEENGIKVEVGDKSAKEVLPELTVSRWDETKMTLKPNLDGIAVQDKQVSFEKDKIKFDTPKIGYSLENLPVSQERPEGGFEYNIVLKEKPATNIVSLGMETENLDFFYQPALTMEEIKQGASRPDDVVGSYAVYYKGGVSGDYSAMSGKNYKAGKAFHIYRPRIDDSAGKWVWGDLHIDEKAGLLTVTIPQDFLDNAVYPVRHAAGLALGYTNIGGSSAAVLTGYLMAIMDTSAASGGTVSKIQAAVWGSSSSYGVKMAIYTDNGSDPPSYPSNLVANSSTGAINVNQANKPTQDSEWTSSTGVSSTLSGSTKYWLALDKENSNTYFAWDTVANCLKYKSSAYSSFPPASVSGLSSASYHFSIYATYTPAAPAGTPINIKSNVNFGNNVNMK